MVLGTEFDWIIGIAALVCGILVLTGHGDFIMKGSNAEARRKRYDEEKMMKPTGVVLLLIGALTIGNIFSTEAWMNIAYLVLIVVLFIGLIWYYQTKCRK